MSLFLWMKGTTDDSYITSKYAGSVYTYHCKTYRNTFYAYVMNASETGVVAHGTDYAATVIDGQWHQVGFVYDGALVSVYIDGRVGSTTAALTGDLYNTTYPLRIGGLTYYDAGFTGSLESLCLWNRALSPSEIQSLYADPYQMFRCGNPVVLGGSGANNYTFTINDGMGVSDDKSLLAAVVRALSEAIGMADTMSRAAVMLRALTESLGIADSVIESTAYQLVETINDAVGLTDAQSRLSLLVRAVADSMGMADAATTLAVLLRTISDAQGMTDGQTLARMIAVADDLGVSDELAKIVAYLRSQSDSVGMTDVRTRLHAAVREITETEGLSDSYSTAWAVLRTISETLGLTDEMIAEGTGAVVRVINDVLGMVDANTRLHAALRALVSTMGTTDSVARLFAVSRVISDAEGITDGAYLGKVFTIAESIGIADEVSRLVAFLRTQEEGVGITDAIVRVATVLRTLDESIQLTDSEQHSLSGLVQAAMAFLLLKKSR